MASYYKQHALNKKLDEEYDIKHLPTVFTFTSKEDLEASPGFFATIDPIDLFQDAVPALKAAIVYELSSCELAKTQELLSSMHSVNSPAEVASKLLHLDTVVVTPDHISFHMGADMFIWMIVGLGEDTLASITSPRIKARMLRMHFPVAAHASKEMLTKVVSSTKIKPITMQFHLFKEMRIKPPGHLSSSAFDSEMPDEDNVFTVDKKLSDGELSTELMKPPRPSRTKSPMKLLNSAKSNFETWVSKPKS
jgi:hypothetical protein